MVSPALKISRLIALSLAVSTGLGGVPAHALRPGGLDDPAGPIQSGLSLALAGLEEAGQVLILDSRRGTVRSLAISPDGSRLFTGSVEGVIQRWDLADPGASPPEIIALRGEAGAALQIPTVRRLSFSPDGTFLAAVRDDGILQLFDEATLEPGASFSHPGTAFDAAFDPWGDWIASAGGDNALYLWALPAADALAPAVPFPTILRGHTQDVCSVAVSPDGRLLASGSMDQTVRLWDTASGETVRVLTGHEGAVSSIAFSPDGKWLVTGGLDRTVRLWDAADGRFLRVLEGHEDGVRGVAVSPDGLLVASAGTDGIARICQAESGRLLWSTRLPDQAYWSVSFGPDGRTLVLGRGDGKVEIRSLEIAPPKVSAPAVRPRLPGELDEIGRKVLDWKMAELRQRKAKRRADRIGEEKIRARQRAYRLRERDKLGVGDWVEGSAEPSVERPPVWKPPVAVHIRWMIRRDMPEVLRIEEWSFEFPWSEETFVRTLRQRNCIGMVADYEDRVIGYMIYELYKGRLHLVNLAVHPDFRNREVGTQMVKRLISKLSSSRDSLTLEVSAHNTAARAFFKGMDFQEVVLIKDHWKDAPPGKRDAVSMEYLYRASAGLEEPLDLRDYRLVGKGDQSAIYRLPGGGPVIRLFKDPRVSAADVRRYVERVNALPPISVYTPHPFEIQVPRAEEVGVRDPSGALRTGVRSDFVEGVSLRDFCRYFVSPGERWWVRLIGLSQDPQRAALENLKQAVVLHLDAVDRETGGLADRHFRMADEGGGVEVRFDFDHTLENFILPEWFIRREGFTLFGAPRMRFRDEMGEPVRLVHVDPLNINALREKAGLEEEAEAARQRVETDMERLTAGQELRWQVVGLSVAKQYPALSLLDSPVLRGVRVDPGGEGTAALVALLAGRGDSEVTVDYYGKSAEFSNFAADAAGTPIWAGTKPITPGSKDFAVFLRQLLGNLLAFNAGKMEAWARERGVDLQRLAEDLELLEKA